MEDRTVTVAIPVLNGARYLGEVLSAVRNQEVDRAVELLVVDSGSTDNSLEIARSHGARVVEIPRSSFSHGGTRNLIMRAAARDHVAFLTQDAVPSHDGWLAKLLEGFDLAEDVALVFGPYLPKPGASYAVKRELRDFFGAFSPDGRPVLYRLGPGGSAQYVRSPGALTFFTDANGCVARWAWEKVPYREVPYGEDQLLGAEMVEAGFGKVFHPDAAVYHSHDYSVIDQFRRCFDEWRALREVYGSVESARPRHVLGRIRNEVRADGEFMREQGASTTELARGTLESLRHHWVRALGSLAGSRADQLPAGVRSALSLEGREGFSAVTSGREPGK